MTTWRLRKEDGTVYGPVTLSELRAWATGGRIEPGDQVSGEDNLWVAASDIPEIDVRWLIHFEDGEVYGPVHILALRDMLREQIVFPHTEVRSIDGTESATVSEALLAQLLGEREAYETAREELLWARNREAELHARLLAVAEEQPSPEQPPGPSDEQIRNLLARAETLQRQLDELERKTRTEREEAARQAAVRDGELEARAAEAETGAARIADELEAVRRETTALQDRVAQQDQALEQARACKKQADEERARAEALQRQLDELEQKTRNEREEAARIADELEAARRETTALQDRVAQQDQALEQAAAREKQADEERVRATQAAGQPASRTVTPADRLLRKALRTVKQR